MTSHNMCVVGEKIGYMPVSWNLPIKISEAAQQGYNILLPSFVVIKNNEPIQFTDNVFLAYTTWNNKADEPDQVAAIKADIQVAKEKYGLKHVLASVGGERNTFDPAGANPNNLATTTVEFLSKYGFDGIDFDLERVPSSITQSYLVEFITALKQQMPAIVIAAAPQVNNVNGKLEYVNHGTHQVYNAAIEAGLFNYLLVQMYNTGGNYVDMDGNLCQAGSSSCFDQLSAGFIVTSFSALKKITPADTLIVAGQPATQSAAGAATIFNGPQAGDPYNAMAAAYRQLVNEPQFGGAMTWEVSLDAANNYMWANTIRPVIFP
eukprot:Platyproteum_vivax@DN575_c0_g1_i1.p1